MDANTVVISLGTYNNLKEFKREVLSGKSVSLGYGGEYHFHDKDDVVKEMEDKIKQLKERNEKLNDPKYHTEFIERKDLRTWSIFEFLKWRKKLRRDFKKQLIKCAENSSN